MSGGQGDLLIRKVPMSAGSMHADEPETDDALVRRLITAQFPHWSGLRVERVGAAGTANAMYRLGADLVVRLPRTAGSADDTAKEQHWLPRLASSLPVAIPAPLGAGVPGEGYPHPWSVYGWLDGSCPAVGDTAEAVPLARDLARFVTALHRVDPTGGPPSYRSEPLAARDTAVREALADLTTEIDTAAAAEIWQTALRAPAPAGPPVWIHADLQPGNMLTADGRLHRRHRLRLPRPGRRRRRPDRSLVRAARRGARHLPHRGRGGRRRLGAGHRLGALDRADGAPVLPGDQRVHGRYRTARHRGDPRRSAAAGVAASGHFRARPPASPRQGMRSWTSGFAPSTARER